jgi:hypothetical protein
MAEACQKLVQGEGAIVDNLRYKSTQLHMTRIEPVYVPSNQAMTKQQADEAARSEKDTEETYMDGLIDMNGSFWKPGMPPPQRLDERQRR